MKNDVYVEDVYHQPHLREQLMLLAEPYASTACPVLMDNNWLGESKLLTQYPEETDGFFTAATLHETDGFITDEHSTTSFELRPVLHQNAPVLHQNANEDIVTVEDCSDED